MILKNKSLKQFREKTCWAGLISLSEMFHHREENPGSSRNVHHVITHCIHNQHTLLLEPRSEVH